MKHHSIPLVPKSLGNNEAGIDEPDPETLD